MPEVVFRFTVHKNWLAAGGIHWANTYEAYSDFPILIDDPILETFSNALVNAERTIHVSQVFFDRVTISTYTDEGPVYDPEALRVIQYSLAGERLQAADDRIDLNGVFNVRRSADFGRSGKMAYRGVALESDVNAGAAGFWQLLPNAPINTGGVLWDAYENAMSLIIGETDLAIKMALIGEYGDPPARVVRPVSGVTPQGVGFNRMNHRWFNQSS